MLKLYSFIAVVEVKVNRFVVGGGIRGCSADPVELWEGRGVVFLESGVLPSRRMGDFLEFWNSDP